MRLLALSACLYCLAPGVAAPASEGAGMSAAAWRADLRYLAKVLPSRHKKAFARVSRAEFRRQVAELDERIPSLSEPEIRAAFQRLVASLGDAHTNIQSWGRLEPPRYLPVLFSWFQDGMFISAASEPCMSLLGGRVERMGGVDIDETTRRLGPLVPHENQEWLKVGLLDALRTADWLYATRITGEPDRVSIEVSFAGGDKVSSAVNAAASGGPQRFTPAFHGTPPPTARRAEYYWAAVLDGGRTAYFQYNACANDPRLPFRKFRAGFREMLNNESVQSVVLDLRNNSGGDSRILDPWINDIRASRFNRKGRLFVLIGRMTMSSALMNAITLRKRTAATFVGEPTGGKPNSYGEMRTFELPNSRIKISYSKKYFRLAKGDPPSLMPDIFVAKTWNDYLAGVDPVMEAIPRSPSVTAFSEK